MSKMKYNSKSKIIVLKPSLDYDEIVDMVESRKVKLFQTLLQKPKAKTRKLRILPDLKQEPPSLTKVPPPPPAWLKKP